MQMENSLTCTPRSLAVDKVPQLMDDDQNAEN